LTCLICSNKIFKNKHKLDSSKFACIYSKTTHFCSVRAAKILDIPNLYFVEAKDHDNSLFKYSMKLDDFILTHNKLIEDGNILIWVTLTFGTTSNSSIDDINQISKYINE